MFAYIRVPQNQPWRATDLQSLAQTKFKLSFLQFSSNSEDLD